jgi:hypothetical protein
MDLRDFDRIADPGYLGELTGRPMAEIRAMRSECQRVEASMSFLRRLVQGRLDIVQSELHRRAAGHGSRALADLIAGLPEALSSHVGGGSSGRPPADVAPPDEPGLTSEIDEVCSDDRLASLPTTGDDELAELLAGLTRVERTVSARRRVMFDRLDALTAELTRRYRTGEASVDALLT